ncbi:hypothetical protein ACP26O_13055 [Burkholderia sp. R-40]|jgi:hypothetical protein|uniref:hypothetical protein n=1 Tax=Burkholderia TaxID=32008 RepID=UPI001593EA37|nr:hypothetical protein [Burkholderia ambifaria]
MNLITQLPDCTTQATEDLTYSRVLCWRVLQPTGSENRVFNVLLRSSREGYLVRLSEVLRKREGDRVNTREYVTLTNPPNIGAPSGESFYRERVRLRNEMIGWIKAQLAVGAVALTRELPVPVGVTVTRATGEYHLLAFPYPGARIVEVVATADDLSDLDGDISWRVPTDGDQSWAD